MMSRLVLGCGSLGRRVVELMGNGRGTLIVLDSDEENVESLREDNISAERADVTDAAALSAYDPAVVFVCADEQSVNSQATAAARTAFPTAHIVAFAVDPWADHSLADYADRVLDPGTVLVDRIVDVAGSESSLRTRRLRSTLRATEGPLAVVMHDNPDPDAIGSAVALARIAESVGLDAVPCYYGEINHQENRALVNLLDLNLRNLDPDESLSEFGGFALVDHSRPGVNDQLPHDTPIDVVIDHHPPRAPVEARFVDLRHEVGSTSTLLVEYLSRLSVDFDDQVATALLYGIRIDTDDFSREVSTEDFEAAARLLDAADLDVLSRIENPSISGDTMNIIARAIGNRQVDGSVVVSYVGEIRNRDALAQAADLLLGMDDVTTTLVFGTIDDTVFISARARGTDLDLGETLRLAFEQIGSAGGHADMAGAQIPLRSLVTLPAEDERDTDEVVETVISQRFLETVDALPPSLTDGFAQSEYDLGVLPSDVRRATFPRSGRSDQS